MRRIVMVVVLLAGVWMGATVVRAGESIDKTLRELVIAGLQANQDEDINAVLQTIHTQSPAYDKIAQHIPRIFENYDLKYDLLSYAYLGTDNEYAVARILQSTERATQEPGSPNFQNNKADVIQVFRKENGVWKFWNQVILKLELPEK